MKLQALLLLSLVLAGCEGGTGATSDAGVRDPSACPPDRLVCDNDPDGKHVCRCAGLFECPTPQKCVALAPRPPGDGEWRCSWDELVYTCTGGQQGKPPGGASWSCAADELGWRCTTAPVLPPGGGSWSCKLEDGSLICEAVAGGTSTWTCTGPAPNRTCSTVDGLPPGGSGWTCTKGPAGGPAWICVGTSSTPPGGSGWECAPLEPELQLWKCVTVEDLLPTGGGTWTCAKGSEFGGTLCWEQPPSGGGDECVPGQKMWCDGNTFCGWGQVECDPATGTWKHRHDAQGKDLGLDCPELADHRRPSTVCACYHTFYTSKCCERPDCIVPPGTQGQICPKSAGGLCDYCNMLSPECTAPTSSCVATGAETFCTQSCAGNAPCPAGFSCEGYKVGGTVSFVCRPLDGSCFF